LANAHFTKSALVFVQTVNAASASLAVLYVLALDPETDEADRVKAHKRVHVPARVHILPNDVRRALVGIVGDCLNVAWLSRSELEAEDSHHDECC
jgi:hypothetical protein